MGECELYICIVKTFVDVSKIFDRNACLKNCKKSKGWQMRSCCFTATSFKGSQFDFNIRGGGTYDIVQYIFASLKTFVAFCEEKNDLNCIPGMIAAD
jgi:hypothetical protein